MFRDEAVQHRGRHDVGDPLQIRPGWSEWTFWLVLISLVSALLYAALGTIDEYAEGPCFVQLADRRAITAPRPGTVDHIAVQPGTRVLAGDVLVDIDASVELAEVARIDREIVLQMREALADPLAEAPRQRLVTLRAQRDLVQARLADRAIRAPADGVVTDVRIRPGQHLAIGDPILSLRDDDARFTAVALLPGSYRPMLRPGMELRLELDGFRYRFLALEVGHVTDELIGPGEARRFLGPELGDALDLDGPITLIETSLPSAGFEVDGQSYNFYNGMPGQVKVRVRRRSILLTLLPGLRSLAEEQID